MIVGLLLPGAVHFNHSNCRATVAMVHHTNFRHAMLLLLLLSTPLFYFLSVDSFCYICWSSVSATLVGRSGLHRL